MGWSFEKHMPVMNKIQILRSFSSDTNTFNLSGRTMGIQSGRCANVNTYWQIGSR